jgi:hypothetical protein
LISGADAKHGVVIIPAKVIVAIVASFIGSFT